MKTKVDFTIVTAPVYVDLVCPYCDSENTYPYDNLQEEVGTEVYFGNQQNDPFGGSSIDISDDLPF